MEHHYLITESIPEIEARSERLPCGIDYEANIYFRQETQRPVARYLRTKVDSVESGRHADGFRS